jgi:hypothetical protein
MSIIIRPAPGVFRRTMPLVIVFGAFRRFRVDSALDSGDFETLTGAVALSRRMRVPLAFSRVVQEDRSTEPGVWLPECRPKVTDRVFDHPQGSIFQNREFASVFTKITDREIYAVGPRNDSSLAASIEDAAPFERDIRVIVPDGALQNCSTMEDFPSDIFDGARKDLSKLGVAFRTWENSICAFEYQN